LEFGSTATTYEPYTERYFPLPISTNCGKNLLPLTLDNVKYVNTGGTWTDNDYVLNGLHFLVGDTIKVSGTSSADTDFLIPINVPTGNYYFSGCADDGSLTKWDVFMWDLTSSAKVKKWDQSTSADSIFNSTTREEAYIVGGHSVQYRIRVRSSQTVDLEFKPMVTIPDLDATFVPYESHPMYFPTGLKSAGSIYDELDETGYITRVKQIVVDGTNVKVTGVNSSALYGNYATTEIDDGKITDGYDVLTKCDTFADIPFARRTQSDYATGFRCYIDESGWLVMRLPFGDTTTYTDIASANSYFQSHPATVIYAIKSPLENYGVIDLGTLTYTKVQVANSKYVFVASLADVKKASTNGELFNATSDRYIGRSNNDTWNNNTGVSRWGMNSAKICIYDPNAQSMTETDFKTYVSGVYLLYELEIPNEVSIDPPLDLSYEIKWGGTEQLLPENTSTPTTSPILADIQYPDGERDDQYFTYREITQTNVLLGKSLNTIMGREVEFNKEALDILMKGE
jgi:hypothetical protein